MENEIERKKSKKLFYYKEIFEADDEDIDFDEKLRYKNKFSRLDPEEKEKLGIN